MDLVKELLEGQSKLAVVGLGYVGMPMAVAFAEKVQTIGFDINSEKIFLYKQGIDPTHEVGNERIKSSNIQFTTDPKLLRSAKFIIIAVPTPVNGDKTPDLQPVIKASRLVGRHLAPGSIVVFESTVYPGVTEDICRPILEEESHLICGDDFKIGYSPERINPADQVHRLENIKKIVSGIDDETVQAISSVYELIITAGTYQAPSIKVAEAAKVVENAQRDINIAFMNELAMVFDRMGIHSKDVIAAMNTKWNALGFEPGLVGGHCIGVDPYYFIYQAELLGYRSQIISAGRSINDNMSVYVAEMIIKKMIQARSNLNTANIYLMGMTFKEDCPDMRNSRAVEIFNYLKTYGLNVKIVDPVADKIEFKHIVGRRLVKLEDVHDADCMAFLVSHTKFRQLSLPDLKSMFKPEGPRRRNVLIDVKSIFDYNIMENAGYEYWSL